jgi:TatD DNase family protein
MIIDTHCHFDMFPNPEQLIKSCEEKKIIVIGMTNLPSHFKIGIQRVSNYKYIRLALGLHPLLATQHKDEIKIFKENVFKTSYIGEVGLDFSKEGINTKKEQIKSFRYVLGEITNSKKIISIHSRRAEQEVLELLKEYRIQNAIFHWYSGPIKTLYEILEQGYYFSINTSMISSTNSKKIISNIPLDRILTETDAPFVQFKGRPSNPEDVKEVIKYLAVINKLSYDFLEKQIYSNFNQLINRIKTN